MSDRSRVLYVADRTPARERTASDLRHNGFDVVTATGRATALQQLEGRVDCVVSAYELGDRNGIELLGAVRELRPELPFVLAPENGSEAIATEAIRAGVTDYVRTGTNGDDVRTLGERVERAISEHRSAENEPSRITSDLPGVAYRRRNGTEWSLEYVGGNVVELTGYNPEAFLERGRSWNELVHPDDRNDVRSALTSGDDLDLTYRITDADGNRRWVRERGERIDGDGDCTVIEGTIVDVTAKKHRERQITEYDRLLDSLADPVYATDADGYITRVNDRAEALSGYDQDVLVGSHVSMLLGSSDVARGRAVVRELLRGKESSTTYDISVENADGESIELENNVAPLFDEGRFYGTVGVLRERSSSVDTKLRRLHDATRELMAMTDPIEIADATVEAAKDVLEQPIASVRLHEDGELELAAATEETFDRLGERPNYAVGDRLIGTAFESGTVHVEPRADELDDEIDRLGLGSVAYFPLGDHGVLSIASPDRDAFDERAIQLTTVLAANVETALDRAETERRLRRERDDFAALFENIPDPTAEVTIGDGKPVIRRANPAFGEIFDCDPDDVVGDTTTEHLVPEGETPISVGHREKILDGESFHMEVRRTARDGLRDFILHVVPREVNSQYRGFAIFTDITEQKERQRKLAAKNDRLNRFASIVSHDLRNPLSVARGRVELARETGDPEQFEAVEQAHERIDALIDGLLTLAQEGEPIGDPTEVDVGTVARHGWETAETGDATLEVEDSPTIVADRDRLRQLLENLFRNAAEHGTPDGSSASLTVRVGSLSEGGFYVADDGDGIPPEMRGSVFEYGHSGGSGTGVGLAVVREIADAHGWTVSVTESDSGGARFEFAT